MINENVVRTMEENFVDPPDSVRPGVYWYFMDGNISKKEITADLGSMKEVGIGSVMFLEVNVGVPRGTINLLSEEWQDAFVHAVHECERLGIIFTLGIGPGWSGSGGPWIKPEQSMRHLVYSSAKASGGSMQKIKLTIPNRRIPFFGEGVFTEELRKQSDDYYEDVAILAFPTLDFKNTIEDIDEKALYYRAPYSSQKNVKPFLREEVNTDILGINKNQVIDLTNFLQNNGTLDWEVPDGEWTVMRFGMRNNGAITRPAPQPGLGFECDKFDTTSLNIHLNEYVGKLINKVNPNSNSLGGWKMLHMDSWEMGAQNWSTHFRKEFLDRRGYDPLPFLPVYSGMIVESKEKSERFLWDLRVTSQELVFDNHIRHLKKIGKKYGFRLSIEPYDMNPTSDLELGVLADIPMCEFWSKGYGFNTSFSCFEASSIANLLGVNVVQSESFTANPGENWKLFPGALKNQGDWAFATGITKFFFHTFAHKSIGNQYRPGMTMGPYGVHWDRGQTWWPMVSEYHKYIARCSYMLQQGRKVADILYLIPEGAPHVFQPPTSALTGNDTIPDHKGYNFDGCPPNFFISKASVVENKIVFPGGASYNVLVLPFWKTMTPELLSKIGSLIKDGATVIGIPPLQSPSLVNYPNCDIFIKTETEKIWGQKELPLKLSERKFGKGKIFWGSELVTKDSNEIYPSYDLTANILKQIGIGEDFISSSTIRYVHYKTNDRDIYFVSNSSNKNIEVDCFFKIKNKVPQLWDPITSIIQYNTNYQIQNEYISIPISFSSYQSFFVVFSEKDNTTLISKYSKKNEKFVKSEKNIMGDWNISFDPKWGGPEKVVFYNLDDWSKRTEEGIKYYSGTAVYKKNFDLNENDLDSHELFLELGEVHNIARVRLNEKDLGIVWTAPLQIDITKSVKTGINYLEIEVTNLWVNRLIGDEQLPFDGVINGEWPNWLLSGKQRTSGRFTFTTSTFYKKDSVLLKSGLIGPVKIILQKKINDN
ncbi:MAG: glycosyl hydrolase [Melioribacteraceae bacterium]